MENDNIVEREILGQSECSDCNMNLEEIFVSDISVLEGSQISGFLYNYDKGKEINYNWGKLMMFDKLIEDYSVVPIRIILLQDPDKHLFFVQIDEGKEGNHKRTLGVAYLAGSEKLIIRENNGTKSTLEVARFNDATMMFLSRNKKKGGSSRPGFCYAFPKFIRGKTLKKDSKHLKKQAERGERDERDEEFDEYIKNANIIKTNKRQQVKYVEKPRQKKDW